MWVGLDRFSQILVDATLAATILLSLVVVWMLLCRQPARRIVLAQAAVVLAVLMLPLVSLDVLPRMPIYSWVGLPQPGPPREGRQPRVPCCNWETRRACTRFSTERCRNRRHGDRGGQAPGRCGWPPSLTWPAWQSAWPGSCWASGAWVA